MSFTSFYRICDAFLNELKPNVYGDQDDQIEEEQEQQEQQEQQEKDETKYHFCLDLSSYIIYLLTLFGFERVAIEGNEIKHHVY
jgi:hypothetical protein